MPSFTHHTSRNAAAASAVPPPHPTSTIGVTTTSSATRSQWTKTFANGDTYHGEALHVNDANQKPIKDGRGRYTWGSSGAVYDGEWKCGRPHGEGVMAVPGADGYEYTGGFVDGQRSGHGRCRFANGRTYEGEWRVDEMNGIGTVRGAPGVDDYEEYTGSFEVGKRSGAQGRCVYLNGDVYEGAWLAGKRQGVGEWRLHRPMSAASLAAAPVRYKGPFDNDVPHTSGSAKAEMDYSDGSHYIGAVTAQLRRHGRGVHRLANGDVFDGAFVQDQREGRGTLQSADGMICEGTWRQGHLDGEVHVTFTSAHSVGSTVIGTAATGAGSDTTSDVRNLQQLFHGKYPVESYEGPCTAGVLSGGNAIILYVDGSSYRGAVRHGLPHGTGVLRDRPLPYTSVDTDAAHNVRTRGEGDIKEGPRRRISAACISPMVSVTLVSYDGTFSAGEPDGYGTAEWHLSSSLSPSSATPKPAQTVTSFNFTEMLAQGLQWWRTSSYATLDGTYSGAWLRGLPHGQGKWQWADGSSYTGEVAFYLPSGHGDYTSPSVTYSGNFKNGQPDGKGEWEDKAQGITYSGEWVKGKPYGEGVCTVTTENNNSCNGVARSPLSPTKTYAISPCATVYEGIWQEGKPSGQGRTYATSDRQRVVYNGQYIDGRCEGNGTLYFGSVRRSSTNSGAAAAAAHAYAQYCGAFYRGQPGGGPGCLTLKNNTVVEGVFNGSLQPSSDTTITVKPHNGAWIFTGTFDASTRLGQGTMQFPNGDVYKGEVEDVNTDAASASSAKQQQQEPVLYNLQRHGQGVYTFVEGNQLQCTWRHNVLHGAGVYIAADGTKTERTYEDGVLTNDTVVSSVGASGGLSSIGVGGGSMGNVFTPENEFPNTLSEEALKVRLPEIQQQQQQQRKKAPFSFVRRGEARQASTAGAALTSSSSPRQMKGDGRSTNNSNSAKDNKRSPPAQFLTPTKSTANQNYSSNNNTTPRRSSSPSTSTGVTPNTPSANRRTSNPSPRDSSARTSTRRAGASSSAGVAAATAAAASGRDSNLQRQPVSNSSANTASPSLSSPRAGAGNSNGQKGSGKRNSNQTLTASTKGGTLLSSNSVYLNRFQAGIRHLDNEPRRTQSPSNDKSADTSPMASRGEQKQPLPVTTPAWESRPLHRRLSSALVAGREQQQEQQLHKPLPPVYLQGSLKEMMKEACAIRNSREDEIHLLTEEMRQLNERIWQLRYVIAHDSDRGVKSTASTAPSRSDPLSPGRQPSKNTAGCEDREKQPPASWAQRLASLVQERRVIMEKLQYVVNAPET